MYQVLLTTLLVLSVIIVAVIFMQPANQSSNVFDAKRLRSLVRADQGAWIRGCDATIDCNPGLHLARHRTGLGCHFK